MSLKVDSIKITSENPMPVSAEAEHSELIGAWNAVEEFFSEVDVETPLGVKFRLSLDAHEIKQKLSDSSPENCRAYLRRFFRDYDSASQDAAAAAPFRAGFTIKIPANIFQQSAERQFFVERFVETLFLAMNLALPDGCNLPYLVELPDAAVNFRGRSLSNHVIESAWHFAGKNGWPQLEKMCFAEVWQWLQERNALGYVLAESPVQKATSVLASLSYQNNLELTDLVNISQVLESFLLTKDEPRVRGLRRKIQAVLGEHPQAQAWAENFYKLRSRIVHGDFPMFHPLYSGNDEAFEKISTHYWPVSDALNTSVAVVIALLQDLVRSRSSSYKFVETITVRRA